MAEVGATPLRLLATGGTGELGRTLGRVLAARAQARFLSRRAGADGARAVLGDLRDPESLRRACQGADVVVHLAAVTHSRRAGDYFAVNVEGTANLLAAARDAGVRRFVHLSTRAVGRAGGAYSHSKLLAEDAVRESGLPFVILRPAEIYGGSGRDPVSRLARTVASRRLVPVLGDGSFRLSPVHAEDVARAVARSVEEPAAEGRTYVLAGPEELTYLELVARLERLLGVPPRRRLRVPVGMASAAIRVAGALGLGPYVPDQIPRLLLAKDADSSAAARDLGFDPRRLEEGGLERALRPEGRGGEGPGAR